MPESVKEIERCVENFFQNLPSATIVCISFLGDSCAGLLEDVMHHPSASHEWMFLSHLDADNQPAATILPLTSILQGKILQLGNNTYGVGSICCPFLVRLAKSFCGNYFAWVTTD